MRDVELADYGLDVDARRSDESEALDDAAAGEAAGAIGIAIDLHVHHLAVFGIHRGVGVDEDVVIEADIEWHDERLFWIGVKSADDVAMRPAQHLRDLTDDDVAVLDLAIGRTFLVDAHDDEIAV